MEDTKNQKGIKLTVGQLREKLIDFPDNAVVCAYEGESIGIGAFSPEDREQIGFVETDCC